MPHSAPPSARSLTRRGPEAARRRRVPELLAPGRRRRPPRQRRGLAAVGVSVPGGAANHHRAGPARELRSCAGRLMTGHVHRAERSRLGPPRAGDVNSTPPRTSPAEGTGLSSGQGRSGLPRRPRLAAERVLFPVAALADRDLARRVRGPGGLILVADLSDRAAGPAGLRRAGRPGAIRRCPQLRNRCAAEILRPGAGLGFGPPTLPFCSLAERRSASPRLRSAFHHPR